MNDNYKKKDLVTHNYEILKIEGNKEIWVCKDCGAKSIRPLSQSSVKTMM